MADIQAQLIRERSMAERGEARARSVIQKSMERGEAGMTPAGVALAKRAIEPLATAIREFVGEALKGRAGRKHVAALMLDGIDPELAAFIAIRVALNSTAKRYTLKAAALTLAERLDSELIADQFEQTNSALYRSVKPWEFLAWCFE